jgi:uncharacterized membrane protein required for colicin V production
MGFILDILILFALVGGMLWCMRRALVRTLLSILTLFLATLFSALLYNPIINWFASVSGKPGGGSSAGAFVFGGLLIVFDVILEFTIHRNYPDLRIQWLKSWDHILGAIAGVVWAAFAVCLALVILDFAGRSFGDVPFLNQLVGQSGLVPGFREFFKLPLLGIRPLFPQGLPAVLANFAR